MNGQFFVYIMTNKKNRVLYAGMTNDLQRRTYEHKEKLSGGFTARYNATKLVYYEVFSDPYNAIRREEQIKAGPRKKKSTLIETMNPEWRDLSDQLW